MLQDTEIYKKLINRQENLQSGKFSASAHNSHIEYEVTGDAGLLHQYATLCTNGMFNSVWGVNDAASGHTGTLLLAYQGKRCLGGAQITVSYPRKSCRLPCEQRGFSLQDHLPELDLYNVIYGEISDFVAFPEYQTGEMVAELFRDAVNEAINQGTKYVFIASPSHQANRCRQTAQLLGLHCSLRPDIALPDYEECAGGRAVLMVLDLTN